MQSNQRPGLIMIVAALLVMVVMGYITNLPFLEKPVSIRELLEKLAANRAAVATN